MQQPDARRMLETFATGLDSFKFCERPETRGWLKLTLQRPTDADIARLTQAARDFGLPFAVERVEHVDGEEVILRAGDHPDADTTGFSLPFTVEEAQHGIGTYLDVVDLAQYAGDGHVTDSGRCGRCGYDRGESEQHTEVPGERVTCRECGAELLEVSPEDAPR